MNSGGSVSFTFPAKAEIFAEYYLMTNSVRRIFDKIQLSIFAFPIFYLDAAILQQLRGLVLE
jgi:hypothetical protein